MLKVDWAEALYTGWCRGGHMSNVSLFCPSAILAERLFTITIEVISATSTSKFYVHPVVFPTKSHFRISWFPEQLPEGHCIVFHQNGKYFRDHEAETWVRAPNFICSCVGNAWTLLRPSPRVGMSVGRPFETPDEMRMFIIAYTDSCSFPAVLVISGFPFNEILHPMENESETADNKWNH